MKSGNKAGHDGRRVKYGTFSLVFTAVVLALIIVINIVFTSLSLTGALTADLTAESFTEIGEESVSLLSALGKDLDITITFMSPRDRFDDSANAYNGINLTALVRDLAENYARRFDGSGDLGTVRVEYKELDSDPEFQNRVIEETGTALSSVSVIVSGKYHRRVLALPAFFETDSSDSSKYYSFNGEYRFTAAMLQSAIKEPMAVTFLTGHGEQPSASLKSVLSEAGFEIREEDNITANGVGEKTELIVICAPKSDLTYEELDILTAYLKQHNSLIVMVDASTPKDLKNLSDMLSTDWCIGFDAGALVSDEKHSLSGGKSTVISAKYPTYDSDSSSSSAAYQIVKSASDINGRINTFMPESVRLYIRDMTERDKQSVTVETVLTTYDTAVSGTTSSEHVPGGEMPLALLSTKYEYGKNNVLQYSYVMLIGSTEFASDSYLAYAGNRRVMLSSARVFTANRVAPDIQSKPFASTALTLETGTAQTLTWLICTVVPGAMLIIGVVVFFRRRHL